MSGGWVFHVVRGELQESAALTLAEQASTLCRKYGFVYYFSIAEILAVSARAMLGDPYAGLSRLRQGLDSLKATRAEIRLPFYYALLAKVCAFAGHHGEAIANNIQCVRISIEERRSYGRRRT